MQVVCPEQVGPYFIRGMIPTYLANGREKAELTMAWYLKYTGFIVNENGATSTLPAWTFLVTGEKKYLIKTVLPDGELCCEFPVCQIFGDVPRVLKEAVVILNKRFWFTIDKVFFRGRFLLA
jgi:hypothetical protein